MLRRAITLHDCTPGSVQGFRQMEEVQACTAHPAPGLVSCVSAGWPAALAAIRQHAAHDRQHAAHDRHAVRWKRALPHTSLPCLQRGKNGAARTWYTGLDMLCRETMAMHQVQQACQMMQIWVPAAIWQRRLLLSPCWHSVGTFYVSMIRGMACQKSIVASSLAVP